MVDLARLVVKLTANVAEYEKKLDGANRKLDGFKKKTDNQLAGIQKSFTKFNRALGAIGVGISFVSITRGLAESARAAIEYGDEISKASAKTGVGVKALSELAYAAKQNDIELDTLSTAFKNLQVTISEAGTGSKSALQAFTSLGINFEQLRTLAPEKQFELIADQISRIQDPADKARASVDLFKRAGADLLPMFEQGAEGLRKWREEAERLNLSMSPEEAKRFAEADEAIKKLGQSWDGVARSLTAFVAPALTDVFNKMTRILSQEDAVKSLALEWAKLAVAPMQTLAMRGTGAIFGEDDGPPVTSNGTSRAPGGRNRRPTPLDYTAPTDKPKAGSISADARLAGMGLGEIAITAREITVSAMEQMYRDMDAATQTSLDKALNDWNEFDAQVKELVSAGRISASEGMERMAENAEKYLEDITITAEKIFPEKEREQLSVFWDEAGRNFQNIIADFLVNPFEEGIDGMLKSFADMLSQMAAQAIAAQIAQKIFGTPGSGGGFLGDLVGFGLGMLGGGPSVGLSSSQLGGAFAQLDALPLPGFADGGMLAAGKWGIVGERGPELAYGGRTGMTIQPNDSMGGQTNNFHFTIQAAGNAISRATELQIAAAAARGAARANQRNN